MALDEPVRRDETPPRPPSWFHATSGFWTGLGGFFQYLGGAVVISVIVAGVVAFFLSLGTDSLPNKCATMCGASGVREVTMLECVCREPTSPASSSQPVQQEETPVE